MLYAQDHLKGEQKGQTSITWSSVSLPDPELCFIQKQDLASTVFRLLSPLFAVIGTETVLPAVNTDTHTANQAPSRMLCAD